MKLLQSVDLPLNSDSVEFFRDKEQGRDMVACGMYELVEENQRKDCPGVFDLKWSRRGMLGAACADGSIFLYDTELKSKGRIPIGDDFCLALDFTHDSASVVASCSDGTVALCDAETQQVVNQVQGHSYPHGPPAEVWTVATDGQVIASGADDGVLKFWDFRALCGVGSHRGAHTDSGVCSAQFDHQGGFLSGGYDGRVKKWDLRQLKTFAFQSSEPLGGGVWRVKQGGDGRIFTACMRGGFKMLSNVDLQVLMSYAEVEPQWEALAYGADFVSSKLAVGCTFYDRKLRLFGM